MRSFARLLSLTLNASKRPTRERPLSGTTEIDSYDVVGTGPVRPLYDWNKWMNEPAYAGWGGSFEICGLIRAPCTD